MGKSSVFRGVTLFRPTGKWRAQISAGGKTLSLGDHDTEQDAARAFDRAVIHKSGLQAKTNFPISDYEDELDQLQALTHQELVALLRSRARKSGSQSSQYRGVSLLRQTGRWHAQINVGGRQVHLGFFTSEEAAARAYDRAAIAKGCSEGPAARIVTNFEPREYAGEVGVLQSVTQQELISALSRESTRRGAMELLAGGFTAEGAAAVFGTPLPSDDSPSSTTLGSFLLKAERALPKSPAITSSRGGLDGEEGEGEVDHGGSDSGGSGRRPRPTHQGVTTPPPKMPLPAATGAAKHHSRSPLPPRTPQTATTTLLPPPLATALSATGATAVAAAAEAARLHQQQQASEGGQQQLQGGFPASPPFKMERPPRRSASALALSTLRSGELLGGVGVKRSLSYPVEVLEDAAADVPQQAALSQQGSGLGKNRRKVSRPSRAAHA